MPAETSLQIEWIIRVSIGRVSGVLHYFSARRSIDDTFILSMRKKCILLRYDGGENQQHREFCQGDPSPYMNLKDFAPPQ